MEERNLTSSTLGGMDWVRHDAKTLPQATDHKVPRRTSRFPWHESESHRRSTPRQFQRLTLFPFVLICFPLFSIVLISV